jgi:translocation and assembly module TamB
MEDAATGTVPEQRRYRVKRHWMRRLLSELAAFVLALVALAIVGLIVLDTSPGHRFIVDRISQLETSSGLRIRIGRIEGSIFSEVRLKNVAVLDQRGVFVTSPEIEVDWPPGRWFQNAL